MPRGRLITIEGIDGSGKSTLAAALLEALRSRGARAELLHEPGGVVLSERIAELVKDPSLSIGAQAEALLYAAARAQLVHERVSPLLEQGALVLLDRFLDSSLAYQGAGRELGIEQIRAVNRFAIGELTPDRTLLLRIAPSLAHSRQRLRDSGADRLELEGERFFATVAAAYERLASDEPERIRAIDAGQSLARVREEALAAIEDLVPPAPGAPGDH